MARDGTTRHVSRWLGLAGFTWLAIVQPGCAEYLGTTAASFLRKVRESPDPNIRYLAYAKLAAPNCYDDDEQKSEAVRTLIAKLEKGGEPVASRAVICHTLGELRDKHARDVIVKAANDPEPVVRVQACRALGKVGRPEDATIFARIMTIDTLEDCRIAAIEGLGVLKSNDPRILAMLLAGMDHEDPAFRLASLKSLRAISGKDFGVESEPWRKYVLAQSDAAAPKAERR